MPLYPYPSDGIYKNENKGPYVTEVLLVHLDLFDIRGVVGCVDLVLLLVV